jgi:transcription termination factor Rho
MPVLERPALADSPLADLHAIASELGIDGFRRLRKDDLIDAIVTRQGGDGDSSTVEEPRAAEETSAAAPERDAEAGERPKRRRGAGEGRGPRWPR